jgi:hypothetical protein
MTTELVNPTSTATRPAVTADKDRRGDSGDDEEKGQSIVRC